jgi:hypothetical protein
MSNLLRRGFRRKIGSDIQSQVAGYGDPVRAAVCGSKAFGWIKAPSPREAVGGDHAAERSRDGFAVLAG